MRFSLNTALFMGLLTLTHTSAIPSAVWKPAVLHEVNISNPSSFSAVEKHSLLSTANSRIAQLEADLEALLRLPPARPLLPDRLPFPPISEIHEAANTMLNAYTPGFVCRQNFPANTCTAHGSGSTRGF